MIKTAPVLVTWNDPNLTVTSEISSHAHNRQINSLISLYQIDTNILFQYYIITAETILYL